MNVGGQSVPLAGTSQYAGPWKAVCTARRQRGVTSCCCAARQRRAIADRLAPRSTAGRQHADAVQ